MAGAETEVAALLTSTEQIIEEMVRCERVEIHTRYGTDRAPGARWLPYHNASHTAEVEAAAMVIEGRLVAHGCVPAADLGLIRVAAAFHDHEQTRGPGANESASADAAEAAMRRYPERFTRRDVERVREAILSTQVEILDGELHQRVTTRDSMALALADADLASLAGPSCLQRSVGLALEYQMLTGVWKPEINAPDMPRLLQSLRFSATVVEGHRYRMRVSRVLFGEGQRANAQLLNDVVAGSPKGVAALTTVLAAACEAGRRPCIGGHALS